MKKVSCLLLAVFITLTFVSCKKSSTDTAYTCATCAATSDALAANDASSKGVYVGVVIGSSGTIKFDVLNSGTDIKAVMVIDGSTVNLTSSIAWVAGQAYIAPFTGTLNGSAVSITFDVDASGQTPVITSSSIPGHPTAEFTLIKETSAALVEAFEGTYSSTHPETGTFNILLSRTLGVWGGASRKQGETTNNDINGTIANGKIISSDNITMGTLSGDTISGSFKDSDNNTVTISGKRTL